MIGAGLRLCESHLPTAEPSLVLKLTTSVLPAGITPLSTETVTATLPSSASTEYETGLNPISTNAREICKELHK